MDFDPPGFGSLLLVLHTLCLLYIHCGLMVTALVSRSSSPRLSPGREHCVVFLGKTLYSHSASLHPGVEMGTGELNVGGNPAMN